MDTLRALAERYLRLSGASDDLEERQRFLDYAAAYADLATHIEEREQGYAAKSIAPEERVGRVS